MNHSRGSFMIERVWSPSAAPYRQTRIASLAHQMLQTSQQLIAAGKLGGQPGADTAAQGDQLLTAQLLQQAWIACQDNAVCKELDRMFPKDRSWLNIAELEFAVLGRTVFKKRIADKEQLQRELDAICAHRNAEAKPVQWQFNLNKASTKMAWVYPELIKQSGQLHLPPSLKAQE